MKILLKFLIFILFNLVLGMPEKYDTFEDECVSTNSCNELKQLNRESKNNLNTVRNCDCKLDEDDQRRCCPSTELNKLSIADSTLDKRKNMEQMQRTRCDGHIHDTIYCDYTQEVLPKIKPFVINTVVQLNYSEDCSISNLKLGAIKSDETFNTMTHCCGIEASSGNKIYGGTETAIDEYPWLAVLEYERPFLCGGTLISSFYVLTAAHCLVEETLRPRGVKSVRLGEHDMKNDGRDCVEAEGGGLDCTDGAISIAISNTIVHSEYNNVNNIIIHANDIGLLRLIESSPYTDFIRPICLPSSDVTQLALSLELRFHVAGWGAVSDYQLRSDVKLQVDLPIIDHKECEKHYSLNGKPIIWEKQLCAGGEPNKDTCKGDSGGPLIYSDDDSKTHQIIGITSFGFLKCGIQGRPSVYTKVIEYVPWIIDNMRKSS